MNLPIRVRLTLWYAAVLGTMIVLLGGYLVLQLERDLGEAIDDEARTSATAIAHTFGDDLRDIDEDPAPSPAEEVEDFRDAAAASVPPSGGAQLIDSSGRVRAAFGSVGDTSPLLLAPARAGVLDGRSATSSRDLGEEGQGYRLHAVPFRHGNEQMVLVVALSLERVDEAVRRVLMLFLIAGPAALALTSPAAYWLSRKALRPVERMTRDAQEIGAGDLHERVAVPASDDEVRTLAVTLNAMLARIERGVMNKHRLVADASHGLRTPLAVMRAELDVSLRGDDLAPAARDVLESAHEEVDRVSRAVDNLLALAAADEGKLKLLTSRIDLLLAAEDAARPLRLLAAAKEITLLVEGETCEVQADAQRLRLAFTNLVENAIKFTAPGGLVRVAAWCRAGEVGVTVEDEGPGIPRADREHLFDRYYRSDSNGRHASGGSGLGLAICREVATAHGGRVWVDDAPGRGSAFSFALPSWRALPAQGSDRGAQPEPRAMT
jgi:heavy metal sensor kinase